MASLVGVFAASHGPLIARDWHLLPAKLQERLTASFRELGRRVSAARPDVIVEVSPDHWVNFFLDNLPSVCIGVGESHEGPPEPFLKEFPYKSLPGHPPLGLHIVKAALAEDFEPSISHHLTLDHGFCIPLWRMELESIPRLLPMIVNDLEPPMPSIRRCLAWGKLLARAIAAYPEDLRVAILATGGLSHSIGEPTMGEIDEPFDHGCIQVFSAGDEAPLVDFLEASLALQLLFPFEMGATRFGLVCAPPERPGDDVGGLDAPLREFHGDAADFLDRPADQECLVRRRSIVFLGGPALA